MYFCYSFVALLFVVVLAYFVTPNFYYSVRNKILGSYRPEEGEQFDGIDISHHNGKIDWTKVAQNKNIKFVYIKATEGYMHTDRYYKSNSKEARKVGLKVGVYHMLTAKTDIQTQFDYFKDIAATEEQDLLPILDIEESKFKEWTSVQLCDSIDKFISLAKDYYGVEPIIYSSYNFYKENLSPRFDNKTLFLARYGKDEPNLDNTTGSYALWQFSEHGEVDGIPNDVDFSRFGSKTTIQHIMLNHTPQAPQT